MAFSCLMRVLDMKDIKADSAYLNTFNEVLK